MYVCIQSECVLHVPVGSMLYILLGLSQWALLVMSQMHCGCISCKKDMERMHHSFSVMFVIRDHVGRHSHTTSNLWLLTIFFSACLQLSIKLHIRVRWSYLKLTFCCSDAY